MEKTDMMSPAQFAAWAYGANGASHAEFIKKDQAQSYSWNAGYHLREAVRNEKQAAYHRSKAVLCKAKVKDEVTP